MDLKHDWKALNEVLFQTQGLSSSASSVVLVEDTHKIVDGVVSNGKVFADYGAPAVSSRKDELDSIAAKYNVDQAIVIHRAVLDQAIGEAASLGTNYFQQLQAIRKAVLDQSGKKRPFASATSSGGLIVSRRNFLLDLFGRQLRRFLPRRFNVLLFIDQRPSAFTGPQNNGQLSYRAILLSYSGGQLDQFFEPDFSSLHENRLENWQKESDAIGQYLESRYMLPCYAVMLNKEEWQRCLEASAQKRHPWAQFVRYFDEGRAAVYPLNALVRILMGLQRLWIYLGRI